MYVVAIPLPDESKNNLIAAFADTYHWTAQIPDPNNPGSMIDNPVTNEQFLEDCVGQYMLSVVQAYLVRQASEQAITQASTIVSQQAQGVTTFFNQLRAERQAQGLVTFGGDATTPSGGMVAQSLISAPTSKRKKSE